MKKLIKSLLFVLVLLTVSCSKDNNDDDKGADIILNTETKMSNHLNGGYSTASGDALYFYNYESDALKLYRKDYSTNELTVLGEIAVVEGDESDRMFSCLEVYGDYLYYIVYDNSDSSTQNKLWRIKTDGSAKEQIVSPLIDIYQIYEGKIYYKNFEDSRTYSCDMDGSEVTLVVDEPCYMLSLFNDRIYFMSYSTVGGFHAEIISVNLEGDDRQLVYSARLNVTYVIASDGSLFCLDINSVSENNLMKVNTATLESELIISGLPNACLSTDGSDVFIATSESSSDYTAGLYIVGLETNSLNKILDVATNYVSHIGDGLMVYNNTNDTAYAGRFWQLYVTDKSGSTNFKIVD